MVAHTVGLRDWSLHRQESPAMTNVLHRILIIAVGVVLAAEDKRPKAVVE